MYVCTLEMVDWLNPPKAITLRIHHRRTHGQEAGRR